LGNQFLSHIREVDAILFVARCFLNPNVSHVEKTIDPVRDIDIVQTELMLKDLETLQKRIEKAEADAKTGTKVIVNELEILKKIKTALEGGKPVRQFMGENRNLFDENSPIGIENLKIIKNLQLLTSKPGIFILNADTNEIPQELQKKIKDLGGEYIVANLRDECDAGKFSEEEKKELGLTESKLKQIIEKSYKTLGLITFYTTGSDETRAWTIREGTRAPQASGVIHTDFEKKFICVETISADKLLEIAAANPAGDPWSHAARMGQLRTEGKEYVIRDGDVIVVKHGQ
jgi:GTP-binding protein YchF